MRLLVLLFAIAMPVVAWLTERGTFGPSSAAVSAQFPNLLLPAGWAFSIWGVIFVFDLLYGMWQAGSSRRDDATLTHIAPWTAAGFALTTAWMPLFSMGLYWLNLIVIFGALACLLRAAFVLTDDRQRLPQQWLWAWTPISLHAGWLSLAAFVNIAQVIVAYRLLSTTDMLRWSLILFAVLAIVLLAVNHRMRGNADYAGAATWGLIGVYVMQSDWGVRGAVTAAWCALVLIVALVGQTVYLRFKHRGGWVTDAPDHA
ncbi:hypothetical protein [Noviluteimonas gilva]|uniref:Tryptophan-rich sensory protein n=1 Tax=Noviluteimonas gilva TaxID=2682097 RepID=A0A7C9HTJ6_9GAMM|nr:hypothetical protein [Lysobacter gilvus]MUV12918.1 hypothetical protein [Lysobacter gilvus]